jgi:hypothetical protein
VRLFRSAGIKLTGVQKSLAPMFLVPFQSSARVVRSHFPTDAQAEKAAQKRVYAVRVIGRALRDATVHSVMRRCKRSISSGVMLTTFKPPSTGRISRAS